MVVFALHLDVVLHQELRWATGHGGMCPRPLMTLLRADRMSKTAE